jgi:hypothetical protein
MQVGNAAPNRGTVIKQSKSGSISYNVPALSSFPAPDFLTPMQTNIWVAALSDISLDFFRARHIPLMIMYVRALERTMNLSDMMEIDPDDSITQARFERSQRILFRMEKHLSLDTVTLISMKLRARAEQRVTDQQKQGKEAGASGAAPRAGLTYAGR